MKIKWHGQWYCEYKYGVRIHDYFNIMIHNFPIVSIRRLDFGVHDGKDVSSVICGYVLGFKIINHIFFVE